MAGATGLDRREVTVLDVLQAWKKEFIVSGAEGMELEAGQMTLS